jgi:IS1 family transposase
MRPGVLFLYEIRQRKGTQNYLCKQWGRQFIADQERIYRGTLPRTVPLIKAMPVRGSGIRDVSAVLGASVKKVLKTLASTTYALAPKRKRYGCLEIDGFWTYVGNKRNKVWLIYAYHRESGEAASFVRGRRDLKTAEKLRERLGALGVSYDRIAMDDWESFQTAFRGGSRDAGKRYTTGIEGNSCRLRRRIRRAFRRTRCFSKKLFNHWKAFDMAFFYINYGFV